MARDLNSTMVMEPVNVSSPGSLPPVFRSLVRLTTALCLLIAVWIAASILGATNAWAQEETTEPSLSITAMNPEILDPDQNLVLTLSVQGTTNIYAYDDVEVFMQPTPFVSNAQVKTYLDDEGFPGWRILGQKISDTENSAISEVKTVGDVLQFTLTIPADQLPEHESITTGARGLTVTLSCADTNLQARGIVIYSPVGDNPRTEVNMLAFDLSTPTFTETDDTESTSETSDEKSDEKTEKAAAAAKKQKQSAQQVTAKAQAEQAAALSDIPGVSLAVTPQFFTNQTPTDDEDDENSQSGHSISDTWANEFDQHRAEILEKNLDLITLPTSSADLSLLATTNSTELLAQASGSRTVSLDAVETSSNSATDSQQSEEQSQSINANLVDNVAFASTIGFTLQALNSLQGDVVISPSTWQLEDAAAQSVTPTAHLQIDSATGARLANEDSPQGASVTVIDRWDDAQELLDQPVGSDADELLIRQKLRTVAILATLEDPEDTRTLSTIFDRTYQEISPALVQRAQALLGNPWVTPVQFSQVVASPTSTIARQLVPATSAETDPDLFTVQTLLGEVENTFVTAQQIGSATPKGTGIVSPYVASSLAPAAFNLDIDQRAALTTVALTKLEAITEAITVVPIEWVNVLNSSANFPVSVKNSADVPISVKVALVPSDSRLQSKKTVFAEVPAGGQVDVQIPVTAVGSGDVTARVQVSTATGTVIESSKSFSVRIRANWEDTGTIIIGSGLLLLFLFGMVRTVFRGRRRHNANPTSSDTSDITADRQQVDQAEPLAGETQ